jgi:hypothetical protein
MAGLPGFAAVAASLLAAALLATVVIAELRGMTGCGIILTVISVWKLFLPSFFV